jgi:glycosyltransferase involved in cell wall biosynthesis
LAPLAWSRGVPIVWDMFIPLYDTVVRDRRLVRSSSPIAWALWLWEFAACRAADVVVLDTEAHARLIQQTYHLPTKRTAAVLVGAELEHFPRAPREAREESREIDVLFFGQFIPLHGIETIVEAARRSKNGPYRWSLVGTGQEGERIRALLESDSDVKVDWIRWLPYESLQKRIAQADVCLGIFGESSKAANVIPNKVFQILAVGRPLITRDSPAIRELLSTNTPGVRLVPPGDPEALVNAVAALAKQGFPAPPASFRALISDHQIGEAWSAVLATATGSRINVQGVRPRENTSGSCRP